MDFITGGSIIVDYGFLVVMFVSAVWTLTLTYSLQMINLCKSCSVKTSMKKQTLGWPKGEYIFSKFPFLGELYL